MPKEPVSVFPAAGSEAEQSALAPLQRRVLPDKERAALAADFQPHPLPQQTA